MAIGPIEIGLIVIVAVLVLFIFRVNRMRKIAGSSTSKRSTPEPPAKTGEDDVPQGGLRRYSGIAGLGLILISVILLWSGARLLKWVFWSYSWFLILAIIGLLLMTLSRRK